jgi:hypothetical protein
MGGRLLGSSHSPAGQPCRLPIQSVGKGVFDRVKEKYGNAQVVTTYAASNFYVDSSGQMTRGEGVQALIALVNGIAERSDWQTLHQAMNKAADIGWGRTWDNYITRSPR